MTKPFQLSVKVLVYNPDNKVLLIQRSLQSKGNPGGWDIPGGKLEPGEDFSTGLLREVAEETGLMINLEHVIGATEFDLPERVIATLFLKGRYLSGEIKLSNEHMAYKWVKPDNLPEENLPSQFVTFFKDYYRQGA